MGHLTNAATKRRIESIEVVSDDSQRVLRFTAGEHGVRIDIRDATESQWSYKEFARLGSNDSKILALICEGGEVQSWQAVEIDAIPTNAHSLPKPEEAKADTEGECTPLDIERAKAANLQEAKQLVQLEMERGHSLDRHATGDVPGCPACDRKVIPSAMPSGDDVPF